MKAGDCIDNDELRIYRGEDFVVSKHIVLHQPTLNEIADYGEREYYSMVYQLTSTPQSMKWQLWDMGVDYTKITPFELFYSVLYKLYPWQSTSILFGNLDFSKFQVMQRKEDKSVFLYQRIKREQDTKRKAGVLPTLLAKLRGLFSNTSTDISDDTIYDEIIIDEYTYTVIMDYLRQVHAIEKDEKIPANESTKMILIEDAREEYEKNKHKEYHSQLKNFVSSMVNCEGFKYNHSQVWDMKINAFMDSVRRISKIKNAELLLQSGYSGFGVNLKEIDKKQLEWLGELD